MSAHGSTATAPAAGTGTGAEVRTLPQILLDQARRRPADIAQRDKDFGLWRPHTWTDVVTQVRNFALGLRELGLQRGETVGIIGENEVEHFWTEYAVQGLGGKVVSMYPDLTPDEAKFLLEDSEAVVVVAEDQEQVDKILEILEQLPKVRAVVYWDDRGMWSYSDTRLKTFQEVQAAGATVHQAQPELFESIVGQGTPDDVAVLSYTSGTTGRPKGVVTTHRMLLDNAYRVLDAHSLKPGSEYLSYISPAWATEQIFGVTMGLVVPFVVNFPEEPETVRDNIRELAVDALVFSPRQWESLAASVQGKMAEAGRVRRAVYGWGLKAGHAYKVARLDGRQPGLMARLNHALARWVVLRPVLDQLGLIKAHFAVSGGSSMAPDVFRFFHALGVPLRNIYGTSEMGLFTLHQGDAYNVETVGHWMKTRPTVGPPLESRISEEGELQVRGGAGFSGYYNQPEKSAAKYTPDGWFMTGDAVTETDDGELVFLERLEDMRRLATGVPFPPQFIEIRLRFSPYIRDVMVLGDETRDFVAALVNIDSEMIGNWAEERGIGYTTFQDLSQKPQVRELIRREIDRITELLPEGSRVRRFINLPKELDADEGELTRTRKLRRDFLEVRYKTLIDGIYDGSSTVDVEIPITYQDGRKGALRATTVATDVDQPVAGGEEVR
ncbi:AMP-dependent synthetase/ligase [Blastococcus tunisiensis]|uniref:Acyl-CoA synthetase n=1 Tax=Blastococcus tunisiensis TaxID=1798228 RepID=A0A1I2A7Y5_9ACTN|nr:AMP-binding protein [Blastococcus sp. DSM 46838]SFE39063.1 long-chain acyl-CoA synthetase [Blastococcus sp. DSM 46838]